jgi:hypothetical protein
VAGSISIDGKLDESAWSRATPITDFHQQQPKEGAAPSQRTEVRVLYDERALYIGARMYDSLGAKGIRAPVSRRDQLLDSNGNNGAFNSLTTDKLAIDLDSYHNHLDDAWFEVNPAGVRGDQFNGDPSWDPIWEAATNVDSLGWTAEMRIPYSQLRFSHDTTQTWGLQIWRYTDRLHEQDMWSFRKMSEAGGPAYYGSLTGLRIEPQPRQLEILPYVESREQFKYAPPGDPYHNSTYGRVSAGADMKYLLTSSLDVFYSRRIGRPPQLNGYVSDIANFADTPDNTTILGAAKITGRTAGGYTIGLLNALTGSETARYVASSS